MKQLNLQVDGLDDNSLQLIVTLFPRLVSLCLSSNSNNRVTDAGMRKLASLPFLQYVKLVGFHGMTNNGVEYLRKCEYLHTLLLLDNKQITPVCVLPLLGCGSLRHVEVQAVHSMCMRKYVFKMKSLCVEVATDNFADMVRFHGEVIGRNTNTPTPSGSASSKRVSGTMSLSQIISLLSNHHR